MEVVVFLHNMNFKCGALYHYVNLSEKLKNKGTNCNFVYFDNAPVSNDYILSKKLLCRHVSTAENILKAADFWMADHFPVLEFVRSINNRFRKPIVITLHFLSLLDSVVPPKNIRWKEIILCFNKFSQDYLLQKGLSSRVIRPIINEADIQVSQFDSDRKIAIGDLCVRKGIAMFTNIALSLKDVNFLGVKNYNEKQDFSSALSSIKNIEVMNYVRPVSLFLRRVKVLIVPSITESWCRIAFEAMYNGIPVIYTRPYLNETGIAVESTEGMQEWIQQGALSCKHDDVNEWCETIRRLEDEAEYAVWSNNAINRALALDMFNNEVSIYRDFITHEIS